MSSKVAAEINPLEGRNLALVTRDEIIESIPVAPEIRWCEGAASLARVTSSAIVKWGRHIHLSEARNMHYVAEHAKIRLPTVIDAWEAEDATEDDESNTSRRGIQSQIHGYLCQLQNLEFQTPGPIGGGISEGSLFTGYGADPVESTNDLEEWYNGRLLVCHDCGHATHLSPGAFPGKFNKLVMCHLDLNERNLLLDDEGGIWLIDWGSAGAYPPWPAENYNFSGRTKVLEDLHSALRGQRDAQPETTPTCCIIHGIGGIGKTEIALQYTYDEMFSQYYDAVFWIRAETPVDVLPTFAMIGEKLTDTLTPFSSRENSQERASGIRIVVAQEWLETTTSRWLLRFDNVEKAQVIKDYIPKKVTCGSIIITTQLPQLGKVTRNPVKLALPSLNSAQGAELLLRSLDKNSDDASEEEQRLARRISEFVRGLLLSITTSGGYMEQSMFVLDQFLTNLHESDAMWVNPVSPCVVDAGDYDKTLATVFDIALKALSESSRKLLDIIAFLNADMILEEMFLAQHRNASLRLLSQEESKE
ncbi:hypothetical protein IFR05_007692 [Cadophora sp. M221]|nr:hypothetical protein IFR05_007692 [Cadophora sp. M221]